MIAEKLIVKYIYLKEKDYQSKLRIPIIFKIKKKILNFFIPNIISVYGLSFIDKIYFSLKIKFRNKKNQIKKKDLLPETRQKKTYSKPPLSDEEMLNLAKKFHPKSFDNIHNFNEIKRLFARYFIMFS